MFQLICSLWSSKESPYGTKIDDNLSTPYDKSQSHKDALSFSVYSLSKWELFRACASREFLLMKRNSFIYIFKTAQVKICTFLYVHRSILLLLLFFFGGGGGGAVKIYSHSSYCIHFLFLLCLKALQNLTGLILFLQLFIIACITMTVFVYSDGYWSSSWKLLYGCPVLCSYPPSCCWDSRVVRHCSKAWNIIQTKIILFLPSLGLCDSCKCFKGSHFICWISTLEISYLLCFGYSPEAQRWAWQENVNLSLHFPYFWFINQ